MEVPIIVVIAGVLWWIEIGSLFILYAFFILEKCYLESSLKSLLMFFMLIGAIAILVIPYFKFPENILFFSLYILILPFGLHPFNEAEREAKNKRINKDNEEIRNILKHLEKDSDNAGLYMRLGYLYKDLGDIKNALESFKKARELTGEDVLTATEREIKGMEHEIQEEESKKPHICRHCGTHNYSTRLLCEKCKKMLDSSIIDYFKRLLKITTNTGPIAVSVLIIFVISIILFAFFLDRFANLVFYVLLLGTALFFEMSILGWKEH